jgi:hypothetical protein
MTAATAAWPTLTREVGSIYLLRSGGVLVETGGPYPTWRADVDAGRALLLGLGLPADGPVVDFEPAS